MTNKELQEQLKALPDDKQIKVWNAHRGVPTLAKIVQEDREFILIDYDDSEEE